MSTSVKRKPEAGYIGDNIRWNEFRAKLEANGVCIRWMWEARTNRDLKWPNVHCIALGGDIKLRSNVAIVVDYNATMGSGNDLNNGFGLFLDDRGLEVDKEIDHILGR
jgi:hypothetical protein